MSDLEKAVKAMGSVERKRLTMAEIGIDEARTLLERRGLSQEHMLMEILAEASDALASALFAADGGFVRRERLIEVRDTLTKALPMDDADLQRAS